MGLFSKVFRAVFGQSDGGKTQGGTDFEKQVRKDGVAHAGKRIAEELTERIEILTARTGTKVKELAKQFVLEDAGSTSKCNTRCLTISVFQKGCIGGFEPQALSWPPV